jgi:hypothetical protein
MFAGRHIKIAVFIYLIGSGFFFLLYAPHFLTCADDLKKSQAVVLFLGGAKDMREQQALALLKGGFAEYLLIPGNHEALRYQNGNLQSVSLPSQKRLYFMDMARKEPSLPQQKTVFPANSRAVFPGYPKHWENTHVEVYRARRMMEALGIHDALMVSAPWHMRRIKMISSHVFSSSLNGSAPESANEGSFGDFSIGFVPTLYEKLPDPLWFLNPKDFEAVATEYVKIAWFKMYSMLGR